MFKADVVSETLEASYVEGVWIHPNARRQGYGRNCMGQLARMLFCRSICLFVNAGNKPAQSFYKGCSYNLRASYGIIFLK